MTNKEDNTARLRMVAWEITRSCNLFCAHCRSASTADIYGGELSTKQCLVLVDSIIEVGKPIIIFTGGEPLLRHDLFQIARYAVEKGLKVVMGSNGTLITREVAHKLKAIPISRVAVSIDFPTPELQDRFRGKSGAFEAAMTGIDNLRQAGIEVQLNSTITRLNLEHLNELLNLALKIGAVAFHPFMLVPTGRGKELKNIEISSEEYEQTLHWVYEKQKELGGIISLRPTDAPHYQRIVREKARSANQLQPGPRNDALNTTTRGCLAGIGFCFISHCGQVQGCGYLDIEAGNIRDQSFDEIWTGSTLFQKLRDLSNIKGKCGMCEYKSVCGGCRARAYESTGDYLEAEPYCIYKPALSRQDKFYESR